ncbi:Uu.00g110270.m01.CDS01 [Anthostomella pinea]|uniref:Uu.00g110270.m01.CDS01 n=1 Tax=Anthostomella pinea TaxID=933095 RepID=A0AAI8VEU2_9PEZI|nr:Uu.00g110270.m01.CDS01 [Anthostomella pinea]
MNALEEFDEAARLIEVLRGTAKKHEDVAVYERDISKWKARMTTHHRSTTQKVRTQAIEKNTKTDGANTGRADDNSQATGNKDKEEDPLAIRDAKKTISEFMRLCARGLSDFKPTEDGDCPDPSTTMGMADCCLGVVGEKHLKVFALVKKAAEVDERAQEISQDPRSYVVCGSAPGTCYGRKAGNHPQHCP